MESLPEQFTCYRSSTHDPLSSPIFLNPETTHLASALTGLEECFSQTLNLSRKPYFSLLLRDKEEGLSRLKFNQIPAGWRHFSTENVEVFFRVRCSLPKIEGIRYIVLDRTEQDSVRQVLELSRATFDKGPSFVTNFLHMVSRHKDRYYLVTAMDERDSLVGAGHVFCEGTSGVMTGGFVLDAYRNQGVWSALFSKRQQVSFDAGVRQWFYTTQNPYLQGLGDDRLF